MTDELYSSPLFKSKEEYVTFITTLRLHGVSHISVEFAGSGDSGQIESVAIFDNQDKEIARDAFALPMSSQKSVFDGGAWVPKWTTEMVPIGKAAESVCNEALNQSGVDWYNNDGGQGTFIIDVKEAEPSLILNVGINRIETTDYVYTFDGDMKCESEGEEE